MIAVDVRPGPNANIVLAGDVLVDTGGSGVARTRAFLAEHGAAPRWVALTHFHADHAGGAAALGLPVAAHEVEAQLVNAGDPRAGDPWLGFEIPPYRVRRALRDGDVIGELQVVHTPGQTPGHVAYWHADERVAITGDLLQDGDVAWVPFAGPWAEGALDRLIASVRRIAALKPVRAIPGHGPPVDDVPAAVAATLERYEYFRANPERAVWHAVRRALVSHLMIQPRPAAALAALPWVPHAAAALGLPPALIVERALAALAERGVVVDEGGTFATTLPHELT
ncbi:MAG TPA: MBL fold metallo-hydrolase [Solirubrobacter sp.]|nr:MBL fold metallo-hydrolase [Solirubrobacter sp.]